MLFEAETAIDEERRGRNDLLPASTSLSPSQCPVSRRPTQNDLMALQGLPSQAFRQGNRKRRTLSLLTLDGDCPQMFVNDPLDDGQP